MTPVLCLSAILVGLAPPPEPPPVRIGLLVEHSEAEARARWQPTADYLARALPGKSFQVIPLTPEALGEAVRREELEFLITNPAEYVVLEVNYGATRILTFRSARGGTLTSHFGAVLFARKGRTRLDTYSDLRGQSLAASDRRSFGGWMIVLREFKDQGLDPEQDLRRLQFLGTEDAVLAAVRKGEVDVGIVRTGYLEQQAALGRLHLDELTFLPAPSKPEGFPLATSTRLYPEWPLATLPGTPHELAQEVAVALLQMPPDDPAARAAMGAGWTIPLNYRPVHECLRQLRLPPFEHYGEVTLAAAARRFGGWIVLASGLVLALAATTAYVIRINRAHDRLRANLETQLAEREKAEQALRESEVFYHSLVETLPQNILRKDVQGRFTFVNSRFCNTVGRPVDQILGRTDADLFKPELAEKYRRDDRYVMETGQTIDIVEEHVTPDGATHYVQVIKSPLYDPRGTIIGTQGIFWDVTENRRMVEELRLSRERFELAVLGSRDGIWDWDLLTNQVYYSPRWKSMLGFEDHEVSNHYDEFASRLHPEDRERAERTIRDYLGGRLPEYEMEIRMRHKDGSYRWILTRGVALRDAEGHPYRMAGSHTDITIRKEQERQLAEQNRRLLEMAESERDAHEARKQAQSRMVQSEKLAGLGQMVAGVAHEINNPLSYVSNNVAVLQRDLAEVGELLALYRAAEADLARTRPDLLTRIGELCDRVDMEYILTNLPGLLVRTREGLRRIQKIVKDLRVFARLDESDLNEVDLNAGIESTITIIAGHAKKKQVKIEPDLGPLPPVTCYPAKLNQVFMNLISNAIDACAEGGHVVVRTRAEGRGARIEVEDDGCGIDPAIRERIFDPFFTTKPVGIGTGLGLSISYGIVQDHGGSIEVESAVGRGTRFVVHIPGRPTPGPPSGPALGAEAEAPALVEALRSEETH